MKNNEKKINSKELDKSSSSKTIKTKKELTKQENMVPKKKNSNINNKGNNKLDNSNKNQKQVKNNYKKNESVKKISNLEDNHIKNDNKLKNNYHENNNLKTKKQDKVTNKSKKKIDLILLIVIFLIFISLTTYNILTFIKYKSIVVNNSPKNIKINYLDYYSTSIVTLNKKALYKRENEEFVKSGVVNSNINLKLEEDDFSKDGYFKIKNISYYIDYKDIKKDEVKEEKTTYLNYIPFNESVKVTNPKFYLDEKIVFSILGEYDYPILVKEKSYYGVLVNDKLYYLKKEDCSFYKNKNTNLKTTSGIPVLVYHFTYDSNNLEEKKKCLKANSTICLSDEVFSKQLKYLKDNNFYTATLNDLEMFIDGKIRLPEHTVVITIDDGYFVSAAIRVLEKYDMHGTLFLIGQGNDPTNYKSNNLEIHSHTYAMHYPGACSGGQGSPIKCLAKDKILSDLKKSRESLNNTPYFCYPFFEYNDYAISLLKEAGFRMAFAGHRMKVRVGANKYKLPRYGIINTTTIKEFSQIVS